MASYQVQAKYGDYDGKKHSSGYLADEDLFPQQHKLSVPMWEKKVYVGGKSDLQEGPDTISCFSKMCLKSPGTLSQSQQRPHLSQDTFYFYYL